MNIYEFTDYKGYFNTWVESLPKSGRGEYRRVAEKLNVSTTMISQVFRGEKHLNLELASDLADYLNLNEGETEYLFLLVELARAGNYRLEQKLSRRIKSIQKEMQKLEVRLKKDKELGEDTKVIFYSNWIYAAVRHLVALPQVRDIHAIGAHLNIPTAQIQKVLDFLLKEGLVVQKSGVLEEGPRRTHIGADSPLVARHHQNWRLQGIQKMSVQNENNLFYTGPMSLSDEVAQQIRRELPAFLENIRKWVVPSSSEVTRCLNIDWFEF